MPGHTWRQTFELERIPNLGHLAGEHLAIFSEKSKLPSNIVYAVDYSLSEYLRGLGDRASATSVTLEFLVGSELSVRVTDDGLPFDPTLVGPVDPKEVLGDHSGDELSMALLRRLVDRVEYHRREGLNEFLIAKKLPADVALAVGQADAQALREEPSVKRIKVVIVEDDSDFRTVVATLLAKQPDIAVLDTFGNVESCVNALPMLFPDVVIMDIRLPHVSGLEGIRRVLQKSPKTLVLMLTMATRTDWVIESMEAGAVGYIIKGSPATEIVMAVRDAFAGGSPMSSRIARAVVQSFRNRSPGIRKAPEATGGALEDLSAREKQLLELLGRGFTYKLASQEMSVSVNTIRCYVRRIYQKLGVNSSLEAVRNRPLD